MVPAEDNFADVSLEVPPAQGVEYALLGPFKDGIERLGCVVVNLTVYELLDAMID